MLVTLCLYLMLVPYACEEMTLSEDFALRLNVSDNISVLVCFVFLRNLNLLEVEIVAPLNI